MSRVLKMYYLNPNDYGEEYFTIAYSKKEALGFILNYLKNHEDKYHREHYNMFKNVDVDNPKTFPRKYTLDEYRQGEVVRSEIC